MGSFGGSVEAAVLEVLRALGEDPERAGLRDTPKVRSKAARNALGY